MSPDSSIQPSSGERIVAIYSGGMDSFTLLHDLLAQKKTVHTLSFNYGQRHQKELKFAANVCRELRVPSHIIDITSINPLLAGSSLTDVIAVPEGHYEEESMKSTVVPNRNMIMLSLAIGYAISINAKKVYFGAHGGDHAIYPDCRPEFVARMNDASASANYQSVAIVAPYLNLDKTAILAIGLRLGLDYSKTWTCYNGRELACGKCGSCVERLEAFTLNHQQDPIAYESVRKA